MRVAFVAGKDSRDPRNRVVLRGLRQNGVTVLDLTGSGQLLSRLVSSPARLLPRLHDVDAVVVGFFGHPLVPVVRAMSRNAILFDSFLSTYDTLLGDRKLIPEHSLPAGILGWLERKVYGMADGVLVDTDVNIRFLVNELGIPRKSLFRSFVGTDDSLFYPREWRRGSSRFIVHFHGSYQRLHGVRFILKAASMLRRLPDVEFRLVGRGITFSQDADLASKLKLSNVTFLEPVGYKRLAELVSEADLCLGAFGITGKAQRVIPAKIFDAMASQKPIISGDTPAARELLQHLHDAYLCPCGEPESLANAIVELKNDTRLCRALAGHAYEKFVSKCSPRVIGRGIVEILERICSLK